MCPYRYKLLSPPLSYMDTHRYLMAHLCSNGKDMERDNPSPGCLLVPFTMAASIIIQILTGHEWYSQIYLA